MKVYMDLSAMPITMRSGDTLHVSWQYEDPEILVLSRGRLEIDVHDVQPSLTQTQAAVVVETVVDLRERLAQAEAENARLKMLLQDLEVRERQERGFGDS